MGSPKYGTARKNTQRYYTTKLLIRYISLTLKVGGGENLIRVPTLLSGILQYITMTERGVVRLKEHLAVFVLPQ